MSKPYATAAHDLVARHVYANDDAAFKPGRGPLLGWVQRTATGTWWARSIETGSTTTEHDTQAAAIAAVRAAR